MSRLTTIMAAVAMAGAALLSAQAHSGASVPQPANPQIAQVWRLLGGSWNTTETLERSVLFPNGGSRRGTVTYRLGQDGQTVIGEGRSNGSAGLLDYLMVIWWKSDAKVYGFFVCFNGTSPCEERGSARWSGETFVNDYTGTVSGRRVRMSDTWIALAPDSYRLVFAMDSGDGTLTTLITTTSSRQ